MTPQGVAVRPARCPERRFIEHIQRSFVAPGQFTQPATTDQQPVLFIEAGGEWSKVAIRTDGIQVSLVGPLAGDGLGQGEPAREAIVNVGISPAERGSA